MGKCHWKSPIFIHKTCSIAPNYSGTVYGLRNFAAQITGKFRSKVKKSFFLCLYFFVTGFMMPAVISAFTKCEVTIIIFTSLDDCKMTHSQKLISNHSVLLCKILIKTIFSIKKLQKIKLIAIIHRGVKGMQPGNNFIHLKCFSQLR